MKGMLSVPIYVYMKGGHYVLYMFLRYGCHNLHILFSTEENGREACDLLLYTPLTCILSSLCLSVYIFFCM
jgi:hypothetical protein